MVIDFKIHSQVWTIDFGIIVFKQNNFTFIRIEWDLTKGQMLQDGRLYSDTVFQFCGFGISLSSAEYLWDSNV